jgi:hypothetical protein
MTGMDEYLQGMEAIAEQSDLRRSETLKALKEHSAAVIRTAPDVQGETLLHQYTVCVQNAGCYYLDEQKVWSDTRDALHAEILKRMAAYKKP